MRADTGGYHRFYVGVDGIAWLDSGFYPHVVLLMRHCNVLGTLVRGRRLRAACWAWLGGHGSIPLLQGYGRTRSLGRALSDPRSGLPTVGFSQVRMLLFSLNAQGRRDRTTERSKAKAKGVAYDMAGMRAWQAMGPSRPSRSETLLANG